MKKIPIDIEKIREYISQGFSQRKIATMLGYGRGTVQKICKDNGIKSSGRKSSTIIQKRERLGETRTNNFGSVMKIIEYHNSANIIVEFEDGYTTETTYACFLKGSPKNPYDKAVCGFGYLGEGEYGASVKGIHTPQYKAWRGMIRRCYGSNKKSDLGAYKDITVCEEWRNLQVFAKWYNENYYEIEGERMHLDKDILIKENKVYSPDACIFVPERINYLFVKNKNSRGDLPIGVFIRKSNGMYVARYNLANGESAYLGQYSNPTEAFQAYKKAKESYIKQVADQYKDKIPQKLYDAMYRYEVEITD